MLNNSALNSIALNSELSKSLSICVIVAPIQDVQSDILTGYTLDSSIDSIINEVDSVVDVGEVAQSSLDNISHIVYSVCSTGELLDANLDSHAHTMSASGSELGITFADVTAIMQEVLSDAITGEVLTSSLNNPLADISADHEQVIVITGTVTNPIATVDSQFSALTFGYLSMPLATLSGVVDCTVAEMSMPIATVAIGHIHGSIIESDISAPLSNVDCVFTYVLDGDINLPSSSVSSSISTGYIVSSELDSPANDVMADIAGENLVVANITQLMSESSGVIISDSFLLGLVSQPSAEIEGVIAGARSNSYTTYAMNIDNAKVTQYTNFDSLAMAKVGGVYISIAKDGIYLMGGDTDSGNVIDARVRFGMDDMDSEYHKRVQYSYVGSKGTVNLRMLTDGDNETVSYDATHQGNGIGTRRIKLGKGTKSRYWQPEITGNRFEIDSIGLEAEVLSRKVA
jgi:hypothetical protein